MANLECLYSVGLQDYLGVSTTHDIFLNVPDSTTLASLTTILTGYQDLVDVISGGLITKTYLRVTIPNSETNKTDPVAGDEVEKTGLFNFSQSATPYKFGVDVPAIAETLITNGKIDLSASAITTWIAWLTAAHSGVQAISKFLYTLTGLVDALISFRKHRKAENRRSVETGS